MIDAGSGNNTVRGTVAINMSEGNSTLTGDSSVQTYQYVDGNHVITNYSGEDIIEIAAGKLDSYSFDGGDLIFHIGNGSLRLKNMTNHAITVTDSAGKTTTQIYGTGYSGQSVIKNFVKSLSNTVLDRNKALDEAIQACSQFKSFQEVIDQLLNDCRNTYDAETFLRNYCNIFFDNIDTGAIAGWDAGGLKIKAWITDVSAKDFRENSIEWLMPQTDMALYPITTSFTKGGLTVNVPKKDSLTKEEQYVVRGMYSWWLEDAVNFLEESYGRNFYSDNVKFNSMTLNFIDDESVGAWGYVSGSNMTVNMAHTRFEDENDFDGNGIPWMLIHEFTHIFQFANFNIWPPDYIIEGMGNLTMGWDSDAVKELVSNPENLAECLNINDPQGDAYSGGYVFLRYLAKQASDSYDSSKGYAWKDDSSIVGTDDAELLTGSGRSVTISAGKGNDTITAYGENMKVFGEDGDDYILIGSVANGAKVYGGAGNDSISNEGLQVTITAGAGNDFILNSGGQSVKISASGSDNYIDNNSNYKYNSATQTYNTITPDKATITTGAGKDTITNYGSKTSISSGAGNDSIDNYGSNVTIKGGSDNDFLINGGYWESERGGANVSLMGGSGNDTITSHGSKSMLDGGTGNDLIYNGYRYYQPWDAFYDSDSDEYNGNNSTILGGSGNDTIKNRGSNVTIEAGAGNDSIILSGTGQNNLVQYKSGDGNDLIQGFNESSTLQIGKGKGTYSTKASGSDVIVTVGKGKITLIGVANLENVNIEGVTTTLTLTDKDKFSVKIDSAVKTVDASSRTESIKITGNPLDNTIKGSAEADTISGGSGDDKLYGNAGNDSLSGGDGADTLSGYTGNDKLLGGSGNDSLSGGDGKDTLSGGSGNDKLLGGTGNDCIKGGSGNDSLWGGKGNDTLWGDAGSDKFIYSKGDGKDIIFGFDNKDTLTLNNLTFTTSYSKSKGTITFKVDGGSVMLKEFTATTFHINDDTYKISSSKLIKK